MHTLQPSLSGKTPLLRGIYGCGWRGWGRLGFFAGGVGLADLPPLAGLQQPLSPAWRAGDAAWLSMLSGQRGRALFP